MALDVQTIAMTGSYIPYERPPQPFTLWSAIPRGMQSFLVAAETLDAKALNDDALLQLTATLPPNFAYVMADMQFTISQGRAFDWTNKCNLNLQNFYRAPVNLSLALQANYPQDFALWSQDLAVRSLEVTQPWPTFPIIGSPDATGILINISSFNNIDAASTAGTVDAYISFWQFDLEQVRKYPINSPQPVHAR